ncbi:MAG: UDP-N-acetylglucosamine 1-carboxyvinyltransferase [Actinobacteria bacterium]|nr:UDP-N-acetylglucosamine 1-carboxyvinyltransferase [Actinomycetota bacterium]
MDHFIVEGGNRLEGSVTISGAKNSVLKLMAASILGRGMTHLSNVPRIADVFIMADVLRELGATVEFKDDVLEIDTSSELRTVASYELVRRMRASFNVLGPLLGRYGHARVALPGGCNIGMRPVDLHERSLASLGVAFSFDHGYLEGVAPELTGSRIVLDFPSRGATENLLTASVMARGTTVIENAAREPDIIDLAEFLNRMGARVHGAGTSTIEVEGVEELNSASYVVPSDPIEAGTFALAVLATRGDGELVGARPGDLEVFLNKITQTGALWTETDRGIRVSISTRPRSVDFVTLPHPGFPTDLLAQMISYLATADGTSIATENIFESRYMYVAELNRMGADISIEGHHAVIRGIPKLQGTQVRATDLRAGAALLIAALSADGPSEIHDIHHIDRGYEDLDDKLRQLGARVSRISETSPAFLP